MSLVLKINSVPLTLGGIVAVESLIRAEFRKAGPLRRLLAGLPLGKTVFQADNCKLECFDDEFIIYPCTYDYLNRDRRWQTKATVFLEADRVSKLEFQIVDGHYAASNFLDRFHKACSATLGEPVEKSLFLTRWRNGTAAVTSILHADMVNVNFLMEYQDT